MRTHPTYSKSVKDDFTYHCRQHIADSENNLLVFDPKLDFSTQGGAYFCSWLEH